RALTAGRGPWPARATARSSQRSLRSSQPTLELRHSAAASNLLASTVPACRGSPSPMLLRDPVHGLGSLEADELSLVPRLMQPPEVQRLRRIRQLGLTSFAYPGADHTRFSHAIGAAHVMTRFIGRLRSIHGDLPRAHQLTPEHVRDAVAAAFLHDLGH